MITLSAFSDEAASSLSGQIAALKRNKIGYTELRSIDGRNISELTVADATECAKQLAYEDIRVWAIGSPIGKVSIHVDFEEYLEKVKRVCELANVFNTNKIRMFSFFETNNCDKTLVFERLNSMVDIAKTFGVSLYHENEKDIYGDTVDNVLKIMKNVPDLKFVFDPANYVQVNQNISHALSTLHSHSDYFHIKDVIADTGELVPAGYGDAQIAKLIELINADKTLTLEPHLALFDAYSTIDNTEMKHRYHFQDNDTAFDTAVKALKTILSVAGYREAENGMFKK